MILAPAPSVNRRVQDDIFRRHNLSERIQVVMESHDTDVVVKYAASGLGIALWHMSLEVAEAVPGLHARVFDPARDRLSAVLVVRKHAHLPPLVQTFRTLLRQFLSGRPSSENPGSLGKAT
jgi:DNA-binding transcriptional LysR family regulator